MAEVVSIAPENEGDIALSVRLGRWWQLSLGVICMSMIANLQYGWTLFVNPIHDKHGWSLSAIQVAFTVFVVVETWLVPVEGYLVDRFGPQLVGVAAGIMVALAWVINSMATTLPMLYLGAVVAGLGAGAVYGACVGNALKWFPDRRGLAAGLTAMGYGAGSAFTVSPIANMIKAQGYEATFFKFGIVQGAVVFIVAWFLRAPDPQFMSTHAPAKKKNAPARARENTPMEMLRTPTFWIMYAMFVLTAAGGLIATAQLTPIAKDFGLAATPITMLGITSATLTMALSMNRVLNGVSRPFFGWVSDHLGRENTMFVAFAIEGVSILLLAQFGASPFAFVVLTGVTFFAYGEIYSLFPAMCGDAYGRKFASANAGLMYTAKGAASLLVPLSSVIGATKGGWHSVFIVAAMMNLLAAVLALVALKPARIRLEQA
ncbi:MAG TPA: oxalate/formate MFS antiporter [Gemmatimonadaceae bacterium]|nr:oxalate/formate MFS antiporter [Gemmatimonadaceae bacterium]